MGWFDKTLLGSIVTPYEKKVRIYLQEGYEYEVSPVLEHVFLDFVHARNQRILISTTTGE
jgi:hypothetical protein